MITSADRHPSHISVNDMCWTCSRAHRGQDVPGCDGYRPRPNYGPDAPPFEIDPQLVELARLAATAGREQHRANDTRQIRAEES